MSAPPSVLPPLLLLELLLPPELELELELLAVPELLLPLGESVPASAAVLELLLQPIHALAENIASEAPIPIA